MRDWRLFVRERLGRLRVTPEREMEIVAELAQQFDPSHLKPDEMIRVIDDAHLIGFGVPNTEFYVVMRQRRWIGWRRNGHLAKFVGTETFVKRARRR